MIRTPLDYLLLALAGGAFATALALAQAPDPPGAWNAAQVLKAAAEKN